MGVNRAYTPGTIFITTISLYSLYILAIVTNHLPLLLKGESDIGYLKDLFSPQGNAKQRGREP